MSDRLVLAIPSKGRLMEQTAEFLTRAGLNLRKTGPDRGYRGEIEGLDGVDVTFISSAEIATDLKSGRVHMGVTGEDLVREQMADADVRIRFLAKLGFGRADVVVAVPQSWIDVRTMADLDEIAEGFRRVHGRWLRVATKYMNLTRRFFAAKGVADYRILPSLGATEGTPAAGSADLIVDITTTGSTLRANGLKVIDDGVILRSEATLMASNAAPWSPPTLAAREEISRRLGAAVSEKRKGS